MISREHQIVIIAYLAEKLDCEENWFTLPSQSFFGASPYEVVLRGDGDTIIEFLEIRLGLTPGAGF